MSAVAVRRAGWVRDGMACFIIGKKVFPIFPATPKAGASVGVHVHVFFKLSESICIVSDF